MAADAIKPYKMGEKQVYVCRGDIDEINSWLLKNGEAVQLQDAGDDEDVHRILPDSQAGNTRKTS